MSLHRRSLTVVAVATLTLAGLGVNANAEDAAPSSPSSSTTGRPAAKQPEPVARGLIVQTTTTTPSDGALAATDDALGSKADVATDDKLTGKISTIDFDQTVSSDVAADVAATVAKRADVVWAAPNTLRRQEAAPPVTPNDPYFPKQKNLWDSSATSPTGGYSIKAPSLWQATKGVDSVRVAVLDTGILQHPDLVGQTVAGWDMIGSDPLPDGSPSSDPATYENAGDGDGRDADPSDPGDWAAKGFCYRNSPAYPSSWHGTFVAGQIAAKDDNGIGISGVAPGVKVQPVRVLGHCGGWDSDIIAGITWASGGHVDGVPDNTTPSQVLNLSLGYTYDTAAERASACVPYAAAASDARAHGSVLVAAAGNDGANANLAVPASCSGFYSVGATSGRGFSASYSNIGSSVDFSAPGGDMLVEGTTDGIVSLGNSGTTGPAAGGWKYVRYEGTSMAAPQISAAAALLYSLGFSEVNEIDSGLEALMRPHRPYSTTYARKAITYAGQTYYIDLNCSGHDWCGSGTLDLSRAELPLGPPSVIGKAVIGEPLMVDQGSWVRRPYDFQYHWMRDGQELYNSGGVYYPTAEDVGKKISIRINPWGMNTAFSEFSSTSLETEAVPPGPTVTLSGLPSNLVYGTASTATVTITGDTPIDGFIELRRGRSTVMARQQVTGATTQIKVPGTSWAGSYNYVRAAYVGTDGTAASSLRKTVLIGKAVPTSVSRSLPSRVSHLSHAKLSVRVNVPNVPSPTGPLYVYRDGRLIVTTTLYASQHSARSITLPRLSKGRHRIQVVYGGSTVVTKRTAASIYITSY